MSLEYAQEMQDKVTRNEVVKRLRTVLSGELNSVHNLSMQAMLVEGFKKDDIRKQLQKMHKKGTEHARMILGRIIEMGGNPDIRPLDWDKLSACDYLPITKTDQKDILEDVYANKTCKTEQYTTLLQFLESRDKTTYDLITRILEEEYQDLDLIRKSQEGLLTANERVL